VAGDVTPAGETDRPALYVPIDQPPSGGRNLLIRTRSDPRAIIPVLTARPRNKAPGLAMDRVHRVAESLEADRAVIRFTTLLAASFAGLAILLSAIGVYGLVARRCRRDGGNSPFDWRWAPRMATPSGPSSGPAPQFSAAAQRSVSWAH
jgi:hypothetical protein